MGLANPGLDYQGSRHNVGGDAVRLVCARRNLTFQLEPRQRALTASTLTSRGVITLAVPTTFMNESGAAVTPLLTRTSLEDLTDLTIVHDELDLEPGRLQFKMGGGLAGHNGLRSIVDTIQSPDFARLRIGIGRPARKEQVTDWVLRRPSGDAKVQLLENVERAADALELLLDHGFAAAQRLTHRVE